MTISDARGRQRARPSCCILAADLVAALQPTTPWRRSRRLGRPKSPDCITIVEPHGALSPTDIWSLMSTSRDWYPESMHPRTPMGLALSGNWVFKGNLTKRSLDRRQAESEVLRMTRLTVRLGIWHPAKTWFLLYDRRRYTPCNATPLLPLLPELSWLARCRARIQIAPLNVRTLRVGLHLDLGRRNFGRDATTKRVYYIDDELYRMPWHSRADFRSRVERLTRDAAAPQFVR